LIAAGACLLLGELNQAQAKPSSLMLGVDGDAPDEGLVFLVFQDKHSHDLVFHPKKVYGVLRDHIPVVYRHGLGFTTEDLYIF